jgi:hypothetical protein
MDHKTTLAVEYFEEMLKRFASTMHPDMKASIEQLLRLPARVDELEAKFGHFFVVSVNPKTAACHQCGFNIGDPIHTNPPDPRAYGEMCRKPEACHGKGYCPLDPTCAD